MTMKAPATIFLTSTPFWLTKLIVNSPLMTACASTGNWQRPTNVNGNGTGEGVLVTVSAIAVELISADAPIAQAAASSFLTWLPPLISVRLTNRSFNASPHAPMSPSWVIKSRTSKYVRNDANFPSAVCSAPTKSTFRRRPVGGMAPAG